MAFALLPDMACKVKKTPTDVEQDKIRRENERRVREMKEEGREEGGG